MKVVLVMGVTGSGKSTIGARLAKRLEGSFIEADKLHPPENIEKMAAGIPLTDADRLPWLKAITDKLKSMPDSPAPVVVACSALKRSYRDQLRNPFKALQVVYLRGDYPTIHERMQTRQDHFMKADMLQSQLADLEEPRTAIRIQIRNPPGEIVEEILARLSRSISQD